MSKKSLPQTAKAMNLVDAIIARKSLRDIKMILQNTEVRAFNRGGFPLYVATLLGDRDGAALLLERPHQANANGPSDKLCPLHLAAQKNRLGMADLLLRHGARVDILGGVEKRTPVVEAALEGNDEMVPLLVQYGRRCSRDNPAADEVYIFNLVYDKIALVIEEQYDLDQTRLNQMVLDIIREDFLQADAGKPVLETLTSEYRDYKAQPKAKTIMEEAIENLARESVNKLRQPEIDTELSEALDAQEAIDKMRAEGREPHPEFVSAAKAIIAEREQQGPQVGTKRNAPDYWQDSIEKRKTQSNDIER